MSEAQQVTTTHEDGETTTGADAAADGRDSTTTGSEQVRTTGRWTGITALALFGIAFGVFAQNPAAFLAGTFGVTFAAYAQAGGAPGADLRLRREFEDDRPDPGEEIDVTVEVENVGESSLPDVRIVDGVPGQLHVSEGTPRHAAALDPGERATFTYTITAERGSHEFEPTQVLLRGFSGAVERETQVRGESEPLVCTPGSLPPSTNLSLQPLTTPYSGRVETDLGGDGLEFFATREYQPGDPLSRVDWNTRARTGELSTLEFREERAASVVLLIDVRTDAWCRPTESASSAVERSVEGAMQSFSSLIDAGDRVGIAALGTIDCWLPPGSGGDHRTRARELFQTEPLLAPDSVNDLIERPISVAALRQQLPSHAQIILFSPLVDDLVVKQAKLLDASGHLVTAISPNPTTTRTTGESVARMERDLRMADLRRSGLRVVDWAWEEPLVTAISRAGARWSA